LFVCLFLFTAKKKANLKVKPARRVKRGRDAPGARGAPANVDLPLKLQKLARHCFEKWNCVLHLMPASFSRRRDNRTHLKRGSMIWSVEIMVHSERLALLHKVFESDTIGSVLSRLQDRPLPAEVLMPVYGRPANSPKYFKAGLKRTISFFFVFFF
jgi:hypothetical protein